MIWLPTEETPVSQPSFGLYRLRFQFRAGAAIPFPGGKQGNIIRGAFGTILRKICCTPECPGAADCPRKGACPYARIFEPGAHGSGPSGLANRPRPFVFRASHLDGQTVRPGATFHFDVHLFDLREPVIPYFILTFAQLAHTGLGPARSSAELTAVYQIDLEGRTVACLYDGGTLRSDLEVLPSVVPLSPSGSRIGRVRVVFVTPAELKHANGITSRPDFGTLFARVRDRIATLNMLYGEGPLAIDFKEMGERAEKIHMTRCDVFHLDVERKSSRTGQRHPIGGFAGNAEYEGDLAEFVPYLEAAVWAGVGRQTTFGNGEIRLA
jgi:hypothetical protein